MQLIISTLTTEHLDVLFCRLQRLPSTTKPACVKAAKISFFLRISIPQPKKEGGSFMWENVNDLTKRTDVLEEAVALQDWATSDWGGAGKKPSCHPLLASSQAEPEDATYLHWLLSQKRMKLLHTQLPCQSPLQKNSSLTPDQEISSILCVCEYYYCVFWQQFLGHPRSLLQK